MTLFNRYKYLVTSKLDKGEGGQSTTLVMSGLIQLNVAISSFTTAFNEILNLKSIKGPILLSV